MRESETREITHYKLTDVDAHIDPRGLIMETLANRLQAVTPVCPDESQRETRLDGCEVVRHDERE